MVKRLIRGVLASTRYRNVLSEVNYEMVLSLRLGPGLRDIPPSKVHRRRVNGSRRGRDGGKDL